MVQRHHLPLIVVDRGSGRAGLGVGDVMREVLVRQVDQLILAQYKLFGFTLGMLDDIERLAQHRFALVRN